MFYVAPYAGAWIEISYCNNHEDQIFVAPYAGAWIEISVNNLDRTLDLVAPYAGAWIEIRGRVARNKAVHGSHPTRVRGLKLLCYQIF